MANWNEIDQIMPKFIVENPWLLTHNGQCCVDDVASVTDALYGELAILRAENERLREHMQEINAIVDECEYDKKTRKTVDRLRHIAKEALK